MNRSKNYNNSDLNSTMSAAAVAFDRIVQLIQSSNLNFKLELSPFAANISLKKTPVKDVTGIPFLPHVPNHPGSAEFEALKTKNVKLENEIIRMKHDYDNAIKECETARDMLKKVQIKTEQCENSDREILVNKLYEEVTILEKENEQLKDVIENKNEEIKDLEKMDQAKREACVKINKEVKDLKLTFNIEKTEMLKSHKAEIKCWRKELGEERKAKIKLEGKLNDLENIGKSNKATASKKNPTKKASKKKLENVDNNENTICSICSIRIHGYIPEYFSGDKYSPACLSCKTSDSSWNPEDPFSSFPSPTQPSSLVSHWVLPPKQHPTQNPNSITSLISHCVKFPNPGDSFISMQEALELLKTMFEERLRRL